MAGNHLLSSFTFLALFPTSSESSQETNNEYAQVDDDEFVNIFSTPVQERGETSSRHVDSSNMHTFYQHHPSGQCWTKDHPLEQVIGNPSQSIRTRCQLEIDGMQEELHQFNRLDVWELVDIPLCKNVINLKWLWKNKREEENTVIRNKSRLVAKGYSQKEGSDFEESFTQVARLGYSLHGRLKEFEANEEKTKWLLVWKEEVEKVAPRPKTILGISEVPNNMETSPPASAHEPNRMVGNSTVVVVVIDKSPGNTSIKSHTTGISLILGSSTLAFIRALAALKTSLDNQSIPTITSKLPRLNVQAGGGRTLKLDRKSLNKTEDNPLVKISAIHESSRLKEITCFINETNFVDEDVFKQARAEPNLHDP
ncbi:retrovirus-related pol polyprotein from transposon TNT 1-94 [Tanacetum coccineum]